MNLDQENQHENQSDESESWRETSAEAVRKKTLVPFIGPRISQEVLDQVNVLSRATPFLTWRDVPKRLLEYARAKDCLDAKHARGMEKYLTERKVAGESRDGAEQKETHGAQTSLKGEGAKLGSVSPEMKRHFFVTDTVRFDLSIDQYQEFLTSTFDPFPDFTPEPTRFQKAILNLNSPIIVTTNYDTLLEDAYAKLEHRAADVYTYRHAELLLRSLSPITKSRS